MQDNLFSDLSQILPHLAKLEGKIYFLRLIARKLNEECTVTINVHYPEDTTVIIDQDIIAFNLSMELKKMIEDSIDQYQRQHDNLKKLFDETNF